MKRNAKENNLNRSKDTIHTKKYEYDQNYNAVFCFALDINHIPFEDLRQACCDVTASMEDEPYYSHSYTSKDEHGNATFILRFDPSIVGHDDVANIRNQFIGMFKLQDRKHFIVELEKERKKIITLTMKRNIQTFWGGMIDTILSIGSFQISFRVDE